MVPNRILLIRHGESYGNVDATVFRHTPDYKVGLTGRGETQSIMIGKKLNSIIPPREDVAIYCSPYLRTRQTLENLKINFRRNISRIEYDPRIREREWSNWFGDHKSTPKERAYKYFYRFPGGESCADVYQRMAGFIESLEADFNRYESQNILIVSHGTAIRLFLQRWFRWDIEDFYTIKNPPNCGIITLEHVFGGVFQLKTELEKGEVGSIL